MKTLLQVFNYFVKGYYHKIEIKLGHKLGTIFSYIN